MRRIREDSEIYFCKRQAFTANIQVMMVLCRLIGIEILKLDEYEPYKAYKFDAILLYNWMAILRRET